MRSWNSSFHSGLVVFCLICVFSLRLSLTNSLHYEVQLSDQQQPLQQLPQQLTISHSRHKDNNLAKTLFHKAYKDLKAQHECLEV